MGYLKFNTEAEAITYDGKLLTEVSIIKDLPMVDGKMLGRINGEVTDENPTTSWSEVKHVEDVGWLIYPPDWRELNEFEQGILVQWKPIEDWTFEIEI